MGMKEKMLTIAHCANANKGDEARFRYHNAKEIGHILALYAETSLELLGQIFKFQS